VSENHFKSGADDREHATDGSECWCAPKKFVPCLECGKEKNPTCWLCRGQGFVPFDAEKHGDDAPIIVVHTCVPGAL
jgi:hypothetical protein